MKLLILSSFTFFHNVFLKLSSLMCSPITRRQILDCSKLKKFADDNFKFDKNGRKLFRGLENTVGKGEIGLRAISPVPTVFSKACFPGASKGVVVWEWVKMSMYGGKGWMMVCSYFIVCCLKIYGLDACDFQLFNALKPITRRQNFRLVHIKKNCRQHFKVYLKWKICAI